MPFEAIVESLMESLEMNVCIINIIQYSITYVLIQSVALMHAAKDDYVYMSSMFIQGHDTVLL